MTSIFYAKLNKDLFNERGEMLRNKVLLLIALFFVVCKAAAILNLPGVNLDALPFYTDHVTTTTPARNYLYVCTMAPFNNNRAGAEHAGPWIHSDGTFSLLSKPIVSGSITWPNHQLMVTVENGQRNLEGNDLPSTPSGQFPIEPNTNAYNYDRNPNSIQEQQLSFSIPANPSMASEPGCLPPGGAIGVYLNGVEFFNALDAGGRDAVAYEIQDQCMGHPQQEGVYHYHGLSPCLNLGDPSGTSPLLGYALDGFGIYGPYQDGKWLHNEDLDECHGITSTVIWEGRPTEIYHYVANYEFPYTVGCFRGSAQIKREEGPRGFGPGSGGSMRPPPPPPDQEGPPN